MTDRRVSGVNFHSHHAVVPLMLAPHRPLYRLHSNVRKAIVQLMTAPISTPRQRQQPPIPGCRSASFDVPKRGVAALPAKDVVEPNREARGDVDASTCMFWCAVAIGALVRGRPVDSLVREVKPAHLR